MKKISRLWIIIPLLALFVYSCKKEQEPMTNPMDQSLIEKSQQIIQRIEAFDAKLTGNFKSGENISLDSLVWYTEALENYNHARPDLAYENFVVNKTNYTVTHDNGSLSLTEAAEVFASMQTDLAYEIAELEGSDNYLKLTDVALDSVQGNNAYVSASRVIGLRLVAGIYEPFDADDDWIWGTPGYSQPLAGKCNGTMVGVSDGSDEIARRLNNPWVVPEVNYRFIPTSLVTIDIHGASMFPGRLFGGWYDDINICIEDDMMTYYLEQSHVILNDYSEGIRPNNKYLSHVFIDDALGVPSGGALLSHLYYATYGEITLVPPID